MKLSIYKALWQVADAFKLVDAFFIVYTREMAT
jgi:hypothetical protein